MTLRSVEVVKREFAAELQLLLREAGSGLGARSAAMEMAIARMVGKRDREVAEAVRQYIRVKTARDRGGQFSAYIACIDLTPLLEGK